MTENIMSVKEQKVKDDASNDSQRSIKKAFVDPVLTKHERLDENTLDGSAIGGSSSPGGVTFA